MDPLITPIEADFIIQSNLPELGSETTPLDSAAGRVLAQALIADRPLPPYDRVMMDGICFRSAGASPGQGLAVAGVHAAGDPTPAPLPAGHCWEVMTGACLPPDCDTVIPYEEVVRPNGGPVSFPLEAATPGKHVHRAGSDFSEGAQLVPTGVQIDSRVAAVAATVGATTLSVLKKPRVVIFTTGDEVVPPSAQPLPHQVRQSNAASLRAALIRLDADLVHHEHLPDDEAATANALRAHPDADLVLLCGGISKGKRDYVRPVVESLRGAPAFHGVAQRPGKPLAFWPGPPPLFALPGNPMSVLVCFHRYVRPFLEIMQKRGAPFQAVELAAPVRFEPPFTYFLPVWRHQVNATCRADPKPLANSGDFASAGGSNGFIELPPDITDFPEGFLAPFRDWL